jgi:hypothetical protein
MSAAEESGFVFAFDIVQQAILECADLSALWSAAPGGLVNRMDQ